LRPFLRLLTTVLGSIPLLMDPFFSGLAVVILFGLTFATFPVSDRDACVLRDLLQGSRKHSRWGHRPPSAR
jgi:hypothetical protein